MNKGEGGHLIWGIIIFVGIIGSIVVMGILATGTWFKNEWFVPISMSVIAIGTFILSLICMDYLTYKSKKEAKELSLIKYITNEIEGKINGLEYNDPNKNKKIQELRVKIKKLLKLLELLSKMVGEVDSLICEVVISKLDELNTEIENKISELNKSCFQQFKKKKNELVGEIELLKRYIDLIPTRWVKSSLLEEIVEKIQNINKKLEDKKGENPKKEIKEETDKKIELLSEEPAGVLDKHEIRRSLTISLTIVYFMLLFFSIFSPVTTTTQDISITNTTHGNITGSITMGELSIRVTEANITLTNTTKYATPNLENPFIELFSYVYGAVIIFYFSSRAVETYIGKKK